MRARGNRRIEPAGTDSVPSLTVGPEHVYRVTLRGRFAALDDGGRSRLQRELPQHEIFRSAYTAEGTFTYDERLLFFNLRYEVRSTDGPEDAEARGRHEAETFLRVLGYGHTPLTATVVDATAMWDD